MLEEIDNQFDRFQDQKNKILNLRPKTSRAKRGSENEDFNQFNDNSHNNNSALT